MILSTTTLVPAAMAMASVTYAEAKAKSKTTSTIKKAIIRWLFLFSYLESLMANYTHYFHFLDGKVLAYQAVKAV